MQNNPENP